MGRPRTYKLNEQYFHGSVTPRMAYLVGLILSDGHVSWRRNAFQYVCKIQDAELVEFIQAELGSTHPPKLYPKKEPKYIRFAITAKNLVRTLIELYDLPRENKSQNNLSIPSRIPQKYMSHFLRGIFDGDGSVWKSKNDSYQLAFTGSKNFLEEVQQILIQETGIVLPLRYRYSPNNPRSCSIEIKGTLKVARLYQYLYRDDVFSLDRKRLLMASCQRASEKFKSRNFKHNGNEQKIIDMYRTGMKQNTIADKLNLIPSSVRACIQRARKKGLIV